MAECANNKGIFNGQANIYRNWVLNPRLRGHARPVFYEELLANTTREVSGWVEILGLRVTRAQVGELIESYSI